MEGRIWFEHRFVQEIPSNGNDKGVFETILVFNKQPQFLGDHVQRLQKGLAFLGFHYDENTLTDIICENIFALQQENLVFNRFRIEFFIDTEQNVKYYCFIKKDNLKLDNGIKLALFYKANHSGADENRYQLFKNKDRTVYNSAQKHAEMEGCFDSILVTPEKNISDTSRFNVFLIKNNTIFTPPLFDTPLDGILRKNLLRFLQTYNYNFSETSIYLDSLSEYKEVFLTNAIRGIIPVHAIGNHVYKQEQTLQLKSAFAEQFPAYRT